MNRHFSNILLLIGFALLTVVISGVASHLTGKWHWFGRSGSIITICGVILSVRPLVRMGFAEWLQSQKVINNGHIVDTTKEIEEDKQTKLDAIASHLGIYMALIGAMGIWGPNRGNTVI
jgi:hypothetical protein